MTLLIHTVMKKEKKGVMQNSMVKSINQYLINDMKGRFVQVSKQTEQICIENSAKFHSNLFYSA